MRTERKKSKITQKISEIGVIAKMRLGVEPTLQAARLL